MKTKPWSGPVDTPSEQSMPPALGLTEKLLFTLEGNNPVEYKAISAVYLAFIAMQSNSRFVVTKLDGEDVCVSSRQGIVASDEFRDALYLIEKISSQERQSGMEFAVSEMDRRITEKASERQAAENNSNNGNNQQPRKQQNNNNNMKRNN